MIAKRMKIQVMGDSRAQAAYYKFLQERSAMKRLLLAFCTVLCGMGSCGSVGAAENASMAASITVDEVASIEVADSISLTLRKPLAAGEDYPCNTTPDTKTVMDGFAVSHNKPTTQAVTAKAVHDSANPSNDITLTLQIEGAHEGAVMLVDAGTDVANEAVCWSGVAGTYTLDMTYRVTKASLAKTGAGSYIWTVVFTIADASQ